MSRTGYLWDAGYLGHETWSFHVERPERLQALELGGILRDLPGLAALRAEPSLGYPSLAAVHSSEYVGEVRTAFDNQIATLDKRETVVVKDTYDVALLAASGALSVLKAVAHGEVDNGFAAIRPPGHHAGRAHARGFCIFNNAALCARYAQRLYGYERVMIVDWDVHPGDGTAAIFYEDPSVFVLSLHQKGIFTESVGTVDQRGRDAGEGSTLNVPLPKNSGNTAYYRALESALLEATTNFQPELILLSCGFDAHAADPVGEMCLDDEAFARMTKMVRTVANEYAEGRLVSILEGGYSPPIIRRCTLTHLAALME